MSYYDTIEEDVKRARELAQVAQNSTTPVAINLGLTNLAAIKLLESLADEVERLQSSRLLALAFYGARNFHSWWFDPTENLDELLPDGHTQPFETCPHPDCVLVRVQPSAAG